MILCTPESQDVLGTWLAERTGGKYLKGAGQYIGWVTDDEIQSVAGFEDYNGRSIRGHMAIEGKYMSREWMRFCFAYVFDQLKVKVLIGLTSGNNPEALRLNKHFGYIESCIIPDAAPAGDLHIFTMTREQCRVLQYHKN